MARCDRDFEFVVHEFLHPRSYFRSPFKRLVVKPTFRAPVFGFVGGNVGIVNIQESQKIALGNLFREDYCE